MRIMDNIILLAFNKVRNNNQIKTNLETNSGTAGNSKVLSEKETLLDLLTCFGVEVNQFSFYLNR